MSGPARSGRLKFIADKWARRLAARVGADHSAPNDADPFEVLLEADPSSNGEYLDWICRIYYAGEILMEDRERVRNTLVLFHRWKRRLSEEERDIGRHKTEQSVWKAVERFDPSRVEDANPEGRELRRIERAKALAESEVCESESLEGWVVASPRTAFASTWWGRGTRWCTATNKGSHVFMSYHSRGPLRVFVTPEGRKFQAHVASGACADELDRPVAFSAFVDRLPAPGLDTLKGDMRALLSSLGADAEGKLATGEIARIMTCIPRALVDDDVAAAFKARGLERVKVKAEDGPWKLKFVNDGLSKWALGLEATTKSPWSTPNFLLLEGPAGLSLHAEMDGKSAEPFRVIARALADAPEEFRSAAILETANLWEGPGGYRNAATISAFIEALPSGAVPQQAWVNLARKIAKKPRDWHDFAIPHRFVDDEVADALAHGWSLAAIPATMVTKPRIMTLLSKHPQLAATELDAYGLGQAVDHEVAMAMASFGSGEGLPFVPADLKSREFCLEALDRYPRALKHVPEEYLTQEICYRIMDKNAQLLADIPHRFKDRELYLRAVTQNGGQLFLVPEKYRDEDVCRAALENKPDQFPHVTFALAYDEYLTGVAVSGSLLARVPLEFRDETMCLAAVRKQIDAFAHVPPLVAAAIKADPANADLSRHSGNRVSSRYPKSDPIYAFMPGGNRPERLVPLPALGRSVAGSGPVRTSVHPSDDAGLEAGEPAPAMAT